MTQGRHSSCAGGADANCQRLPGSGGWGIRLTSGPVSPRGLCGDSAEVIAIEFPGGLGRVDLAEKTHVAQDRRIVLGKECTRPVGAVVDPGNTADLGDLIAAVGLDPVVGDFSAFPLDLVSQVIRARSRPSSRNKGSSWLAVLKIEFSARIDVNGSSGSSGVLSRWSSPPLMRAVTWFR